MQVRIKRLVHRAMLMTSLVFTSIAAWAQPQDLSMDLDSQPTFIKSKTFTLKANQREFEYKGEVLVENGDLLISCGRLEGKYDKDNQIDELIAYENVEIDKGASIFATAQKARFERVSQTITLTESPEVTQDGSVLSADLIRLLLEEDRSVAEGNVRVKLLEDERPGSQRAKNK